MNPLCAPRVLSGGDVPGGANRAGSGGPVGGKWLKNAGKCRGFRICRFVVRIGFHRAAKCWGPRISENGRVGPFSTFFEHRDQMRAGQASIAAVKFGCVRRGPVLHLLHAGSRGRGRESLLQEDEAWGDFRLRANLALRTLAFQCGQRIYFSPSLAGRDRGAPAVREVATLAK